MTSVLQAQQINAPRTGVGANGEHRAKKKPPGGGFVKSPEGRRWNL